jgi:uncharacterized protein YciI
MFVVTLTYTAPLEEIDKLVPAHAAWLDRHYEAGVFVLSGRRVPRTGGVILARGVDRDELERILASDPFDPVRTYEITEFAASKAADYAAGLVEPA